MKKYYTVQILIDIVVIILGFITFLFPSISNENANIVFYTLMSIYAGLNLCEYLIVKEVKEPLYLFFASAVGAFSGFFLREYNTNIVLSITLAVWISMISIIKIINLENIYKKKVNLFIIKLASMSAIIMIGILISINMYFQISTISYMLGLMYISYGFLELTCDFLDFLSNNTKFLKE